MKTTKCHQPQLHSRKYHCTYNGTEHTPLHLLVQVRYTKHTTTPPLTRSHYTIPEIKHAQSTGRGMNSSSCETQSPRRRMLRCLRTRAT
ncbi:uncharacterized protein BCR38DRAFT_450876 [Pseudomassariella vexata]|uniref:Uncharacterized protein n=1 Tax=Pseudomassariella vexata TaxID=1141098 RepID=A0A1Y2DC14_9PEZI|nr:uncharacterized protein BCR38DRAFT_450876 [Pseudomassariella vexata]ORY56684.1 hypothetical protein BCR38DRAFT_450876 [Pseudomassariella vexata]